MMGSRKQSQLDALKQREITSDIKDLMLTDKPNKVPADLNKIENEIQIYKEKAKKNFWLIGERLNYINKNALYQEKGYQSFKEYCEKELDISRRQSYRLMMLNRCVEFETAQSHDTSKLNLILSKTQDMEEINKYIKQIEEDKLSYRQLNNKLQEDFSKKDETQKPLFKDGQRYFTINKQEVREKIKNEKIVSNFEADLKRLLEKYNLI